MFYYLFFCRFSVGRGQQGHTEAARELSEEAGIQDLVTIELFQRWGFDWMGWDGWDGMG